MRVNPQFGPFRNRRVLMGAALCLQAAAVKELASTVPEPLRAQLALSSETAIDSIIDEYCGTGSKTTGSNRPGLPPHPGPDELWGLPSPLALQLASVLVVYANTRVQPGGLQTELAKIAGRLVGRAFKVVSRPDRVG